MKLNTCKGDWMQAGCASGRESVHRVKTHGVTRDVCAYHSPYDVNEEHPVGWMAPTTNDHYYAYATGRDTGFTVAVGLYREGHPTNGSVALFTSARDAQLFCEVSAKRDGIRTLIGPSVINRAEKELNHDHA